MRNARYLICSEVLLTGRCEMAKWNITRKCGHTEEIQIYGKMDDRERKAERESEKLCKDCYIAERKKQQEAANKKADLEALKGTEKQILWAYDIRSSFLKEFNRIEDIFKNSEYKEHAKIGMEVLNELRNEIINETSAKWFINNKDNNIQSKIRTEILKRSAKVEILHQRSAK